MACSLCRATVWRRQYPEQPEKCRYRAPFSFRRYTHPRGNKGGTDGGDRSLASSASSPEQGQGGGSVGDEGREAGGGGPEASWLSLVDWSACLRRTGDQTFMRVVAPLSLG